MGRLQRLFASLILVFGMADSSPGAQALISVRDAVIHRPPDSASRESLLRVTPGVALLARSPATIAELSTVYADSAALQRSSAPQFTRRAQVVVISAGPVLDTSDTVKLQDLIREGNNLRLRLLYTSARNSEKAALRNIRWRPLVEASFDASALAEGDFLLSVEWREVTGRQTDTTHQVRFAVTR